MKNPHKAKHNKAKIDLPEQNAWKQLENFGLSNSKNEDSKIKCKRVKQFSRLLDKAFDLLLQKLIQQN